MKPELKAKWVEALRSGKYRQGTGYLRSWDNHYCCLGVLCDVAASRGWFPITKGEEAYVHTFGLTELTWGFGELVDMPISFHNRLIDMNDALNMNFHKIADIIEKEL